MTHAALVQAALALRDVSLVETVETRPDPLIEPVETEPDPAG
jgi:hypothetical protein